MKCVSSSSSTFSDGDAGVFEFQEKTTQIGENDKELTINVLRKVGRTGMVSINVNLQGGTATQGEDFIFDGPVTLFFEDQDTIKVI